MLEIFKMLLLFLGLFLIIRLCQLALTAVLWLFTATFQVFVYGIVVALRIVAVAVVLFERGLK